MAVGDGRRWLVRLVGQTHFMLFVVQCELPYKITSKIGQKLKIFNIGRFWLVGLVDQKMIAAT